MRSPEPLDGFGGARMIHRMFARSALTRAGVAAFATVFVAGFSVPAGGAELVIGTGSLYGVYYQVGRAMCRLIERSASDVNCTAVPTAGSLFNLDGVRKGALEIGVVQADWQYHAIMDSGPFASSGGSYRDLRALFSVHGEPFTLVARRDAGIGSLADLAGKRVNIGNPGSGQRATMEVVMTAMGWRKRDFTLAEELPASQQSFALCHKKVDAIVYVAGHPNESIRRATELCDSAIVEVSGPAIDTLVAEHPFYSYMVVPGGLYPGNPDPVRTFGVRATVVASAGLEADLVYRVVKAVFGNLDHFRRLSPAFGDLDAKQMLREGITAPLHEGAAQYFREVGLM